MSLKTNDEFIEECGEKFLNQTTPWGTPISNIYNFEQYLDVQATQKEGESS